MEDEWGDNYKTKEQQRDIQNFQVTETIHIYSSGILMPDLEDIMDISLANFIDPLTLEQEPPFDEFNTRN